MFSSSVEVDKNADRKKGKGGKTVSSYFMGQLDDLMGVLYMTEPSFIRCVVPKTPKIPGGNMTRDVESDFKKSIKSRMPYIRFSDFIRFFNR